MYKLAVFDLDGTLLDTIDDLADACNYALSQGGHPTHDREAYKRFVGNGAHNLIIRAMAPVSDTATIQKVEAVFRSYYSGHAQERTRPYDGIAEALGRIRAAGVSMAVLSNKPEENVRELVARYFPGLVDLAHGQRQGAPIKPDPTALFEIMDYFGARKEACVYIGDSDVDMQTGNRAGLTTVGVSWGFRTKEELKSSGAHVIVDKPVDLVKIVIDN